MQDVFAFAFEAWSAVWHDAFTLRSADFAAEVRFARFAELAFAAFRGAVSYHIVSVHVQRLKPSVTM